jgi:hypothetical protein
VNYLNLRHNQITCGDRMEENKYFYENCCCFSKGNCGSFKKHKIINKMFYIHQLGDVDVKKHLINLKVIMYFKFTQTVI